MLAACADDPSPELRDKLAARLSNFTSGQDAVLAEFYANRSHRPYWLSACGDIFSPNVSCAARLIEQLQAADARGLNPEDYEPDKLAGRLDGIESPSDEVEVEILLSQAYLQYAADLSRGRLDPGSAVDAWLIPRPSFDPASALALLEDLGPGDVAEQLEPQSPEYRRLVEARPTMVERVEAGGWPTVDFEDTIEPGDRHEALPDLRKRLVASSELDRAALKAAEDDPLLYDERTEEGVRRFQRRHGLEVDGILGPAAGAMLNVPAADRLAQIDLNLERLRWLGDDDGRRVLVNLASFQLVAVDDDRIALEMPVIVGEEQTATPSFADRIEYIEVNPYWHVPASIVAKEIAPGAAEDPDYLHDRNMEVIDTSTDQNEVVDAQALDWARYADPDTAFPHAVRQRPGEDNALGRIKFMFPNEHAIYLHDTPSRDLFDKANRTFSHGCIRVENPLGLAEFLLSNSSAWDGGRVRDAIDTGERRRIELKTAVPIVLYYLTAWADEDDGGLNFRPDVYGHDQPLGRALAAGPSGPG